MAVERVHVVTGGARGIGRAVAERLARRGSGVVLVDSGVLVDGSKPSTAPVEATADELRRAGGDVVAVAADVRDPEGVRRAVESALARWDRLDGVLNAAAILRLGDVLTTTTADWEEVLSVNVVGAATMTQAAVEHWLSAQAPGRVVNFTSTAGIEGVPFMLAYAASKAAVIGMTRSTANLLAETGIAVNAVSPNAATRMAVRGTAQASLDERAATGSWPDFASAGIDPDRVAVLCAYLLEAADPAITGRVFTVWGPRCARLTEPSEECVVELPPGTDQAACDRALAASIGTNLGAPSRWAGQAPIGADHAFPVDELG